MRLVFIFGSATLDPTLVAIVTTGVCFYCWYGLLFCYRLCLSFPERRTAGALPGLLYLLCASSNQDMVPFYSGMSSFANGCGGGLWMDGHIWRSGS
ncbi:hypothetical protein EJ06DRAFT_369573 [Trichodelitschia bisporula]|uniref:Uncharacterized protein n=1 Tax=Trichodelitschia bisporula TaxID=703511 RepID=A0A6G1I1L1_9PEZI|nr:hypothetical protein EJ06DRAFT_369573 [Trichodelitschia bisporula]